MNKELKANWISALRSGNYTQGQGFLRNSALNTFCCLGVLAEIHADATYDGMMGYSFGGYSKSRISLPDKILDPNMQSHCIHMNDEQNKSFNEIADWIEANVPVD